MIDFDSVYKIGTLGKTHGLQGEITFFCEDDIFDKTDADCLMLKLDGVLVPFFIEEYRFQSDERVLIKFYNIDTKETAAVLIGAEVYFPTALADTEKVALSPARLVGFAVYDITSNTVTAPLVHIDNSTNNPLFELADGTLIPVAEEWIKEIDREKQLIRMTLPEGLLSL